MSNQTTLHIPLDTTLRRDFTQRAKELGFDSAQAYVRVMIKAVVDGRRVDFGVDDWGEPSKAAAKRLKKQLRDVRKNRGLSGPFTEVDELMKALEREDD